MQVSDFIDKWNRRYASIEITTIQPARVLVENTHLLPKVGCALDLACGLGANARLLAKQGLDTVAWDFSTVAISKLSAYAGQVGLPLHAEVRDVELNPPPERSFDVIVVVHFLERRLAPDLITALRPEGLLFYQTWVREAVDKAGPDNPDYRLASNELLSMFSPLRVLVYREEGTVGDTRRGFRNEAMLVAMKV
jgi:tellurite methyltransferase